MVNERPQLLEWRCDECHSLLGLVLLGPGSVLRVRCMKCKAYRQINGPPLQVLQHFFRELVVAGKPG